jgi:hypothetical protein
MQETIEIIEEAKDISLLTLYEARLGLNLLGANEQLDDLIEMLIEWTSDEIAGNCLRTLAFQKVKETIRDIQNSHKRLFVSQYPIDEITSITVNGSTLSESDYEVDFDSGMITRLGGGFWVEPVVLVYSGGYDLPKEAPPSLKKAAILIAREAYFASVRGDASVKLIGHKESRISYFDPNAAKSSGTGGGTTASRAVSDLLAGFARTYI